MLELTPAHVWPMARPAKKQSPAPSDAAAPTPTLHTWCGAAREVCALRCADADAMTLMRRCGLTAKLNLSCCSYQQTNDARRYHCCHRAAHVSDRLPVLRRTARRLLSCHAVKRCSSSTSLFDSQEFPVIAAR